MGLVDNFKDLFKLAEAVNNVELYKKLSELQTRVMELEEETNRQHTENAHLQERLNLPSKDALQGTFLLPRWG